MKALHQAECEVKEAITCRGLENLKGNLNNKFSAFPHFTLNLVFVLPLFVSFHISTDATGQDHLLKK